MSWGVEFGKLQTRCDKSHDHVECAGSETKKTQTYTIEIAKIIMKGIKKHVNECHVIAEHQSRNSENLRSRVFDQERSRACGCALLVVQRQEESEDRALQRYLEFKSDLCLNEGDRIRRDLDLKAGERENCVLSEGKVNLFLPRSSRDLIRHSGICDSEIESEVTLFLLRSSRELINYLNREEMAQPSWQPSDAQAFLNILKRSTEPASGVNLGHLLCYSMPDINTGQTTLPPAELQRWYAAGAPMVVLASAQHVASKVFGNEVQQIFGMLIRIIDRMNEHERTNMTCRSFLERCSKTIKIFMRARYHEYGISQFCPQEMFEKMDLILRSKSSTSRSFSTSMMTTTK